MLSIIHVFVVTFTPIWHLSMDLLSFYSVEIKPLSQRSGEKLSEMLLPSVGCLRRQELFNWKGNLILSKLSFQLACIFLHCNKHHLQILEGLKEKYFVHPQSHWFSKQYSLSFAVGVFLGKRFFPVEEIRARDFKIIKKAVGLRELAALVMRLSSDKAHHSQCCQTLLQVDSGREASVPGPCTAEHRRGMLAPSNG